jgi:hypothetical protein
MRRILTVAALLVRSTPRASVASTEHDYPFYPEPMRRGIRAADHGLDAQQPNGSRLLDADGQGMRGRTDLRLRSRSLGSDPRNAGLLKM